MVPRVSKVFRASLEIRAPLVRRALRETPAQPVPRERQEILAQLALPEQLAIPDLQVPKACRVTQVQPVLRVFKVKREPRGTPVLRVLRVIRA